MCYGDRWNANTFWQLSKFSKETAILKELWSTVLCAFKVINLPLVHIIYWLRCFSLGWPSNSSWCCTSSSAPPNPREHICPMENLCQERTETHTLGGRTDWDESTVLSSNSKDPKTENQKGSLMWTRLGAHPGLSWHEIIWVNLV